MEEVTDLVSKLNSASKKLQQNLEEEKTTLESKKKQYEEEKTSMAQKYKINETVIELNVGGTPYTTFKSTLCKHEHSFLDALFR